MKKTRFPFDIVLVTAIFIGLLFWFAGPRFSFWVDELRWKKSRIDIDVLYQAAVKYTKQEPRRIMHLSELVGIYLEKIPQEAWGREYYLDAYEGIIGSPGPDKKQGTRDDMTCSYLPGPMLIDAMFHDSGTIVVCLPDETGSIDFGVRSGRFTAPNKGIAGPGDVIELTFSRPVSYQVFNMLLAEHTGKGTPVDESILDKARDLTGTITVGDFAFTDAPVDFDEEAFHDHLMKGVAFSVVGEHAIGHSIIISRRDCHTVLITLGDVTVCDEEKNFSTTILPDVMYINLAHDNNFVFGKPGHRYWKPVKFAPRTCPVLLKL